MDILFPRSRHLVGTACCAHTDERSTYGDSRNIWNWSWWKRTFWCKLCARMVRMIFESSSRSFHTKWYFFIEISQHRKAQLWLHGKLDLTMCLWHPTWGVIVSGIWHHIFQSIMSMVWQTVRLKLPVPDCDMGWRLEFRPMEVNALRLRVLMLINSSLFHPSYSSSTPSYSSSTPLLQLLITPVL